MSLPVEYVSPQGLRMQDFLWLGEANQAATKFDRLDLNEVFDQLHSGTMHLLRLRPPNDGVLLLEVLSRNGSKRLCLLAVAGKGIARIASKLGNLLRATAHEWGCEAVETLVVDPRLARAIMRSGARPESVTLVLPVGGSDGR